MFTYTGGLSSSSSLRDHFQSIGYLLFMDAIFLVFGQIRLRTQTTKRKCIWCGQGEKVLSFLLFFFSSLIYDDLIVLFNSTRVGTKKRDTSLLLGESCTFVFPNSKSIIENTKLWIMMWRKQINKLNGEEKKEYELDLGFDQRMYVIFTRRYVGSLFFDMPCSKNRCVCDSWQIVVDDWYRIKINRTYFALAIHILYVEMESRYTPQFVLLLFRSAFVDVVVLLFIFIFHFRFERDFSLYNHTTTTTTEWKEGCIPFYL